jgi:hypothetical protein
VQYAMMKILIKLIIAEVVIHSLFFFSRFNAIETMVDSDIFTNLIMSKFKDQSNQTLDIQTFLKDTRNIAYKKLLDTVIGTGPEKFLTNQIVYDENTDINFRRFTNIKSYI